MNPRSTRHQRGGPLGTVEVDGETCDVVSVELSCSLYEARAITATLADGREVALDGLSTRWHHDELRGVKLGGILLAVS